MFGMDWLEILGYLGSVLVAVSLMMKSMVKLRWINLAGAAVFCIYGLLISAYPVFVLNGFIVVADIYYIVIMYRKKDYFELFDITMENRSFLQRFQKFYETDIESYFPLFDYEKIKHPIGFFILRNMLPVGLFVGEPQADGILEIKIDFVIPDYRDLKNGKFLYDKQLDFFRSRGLKKLIIYTRVAEHIKYINRIGFKAEPAIENAYSLTL